MNISKIFGKGISINIPKKYIPMLPPFAKECTKARIDQINKAYESGGRWVIKPTGKQIEGGFLGTLASTGIPMAIGLISKTFVSGVQVDSAPSKKKSVWVPPPQTHGESQYLYYPPPFYGSWEKPVGAGVKKKNFKKEKYWAQFCSILKLGNL